MYIVDEAGLDAAVAAMEGASVVAIDTEFMRERTYYARLCLVQMATPDEVFVLDPLARPLPLERLVPMLVNPAIVKVFHAGSQDIEILLRATGVAPSPVFDTQVAATLAGFPTQVGYAQLVHDLLGETISKADTFTDWSVRPLSKGQLSYAAEDVRHLPAAYERLRAQLEHHGRLGWLADDFHRLADPATYELDPWEQYRRVKRANTLDRRSLAVLREVAAWRELEAQKSDVPKRWLMSDESLVEIARRRPKSSGALAGIRGVSEKVAVRRSDELVRVIALGEAVPDEDLPRLPRRDRMPADAHAVADLLSAVLRVRAREHGVAPSLIASRDELERFAGGERETSPLTSGWRHTLVGAELEDVLDGRMCVGVHKGRIAMGPLHDARAVSEEPDDEAADTADAADLSDAPETTELRDAAE